MKTKKKVCFMLEKIKLERKHSLLNRDKLCLLFLERNFWKWFTIYYRAFPFGCLLTGRCLPDLNVFR